MAKKKKINPAPGQPAAVKAATASKTSVPKAPGRNWFDLPAKLALLLGVIAFLVYANTLKNGYVLDDSSSISENTIVQKGVSAIPELLSTPYRRGFYITENDLYRPLSLVTLAIEYEYFGLNPTPNHFVNMLLFAGCVIALFFFLDRFFERKRTAVAFIASLLFALHPIHTEVVANIKSRDELLCFFFAFLSMNMMMGYMRSGNALRLLGGGLLFFLAFLSKETVVTFLAVFPLVFFFYRNEHKKRAIYISVVSVLITAVFLYIRYTVLHEYGADKVANTGQVDNALAATGLSAESRIATAMLILGYYMKLLLVPYPLICDYAYNSFPYTHFSDWRVLLTFVMYAALGVHAIVRLVQKKKDPYAFAILFFLITISLFTNIFFIIGATAGERFLFFGSVSFCLAAAVAIDQFLAIPGATVLDTLKNPKVLGVIVVVGLTYAGITTGRNAEWRDNYTLYKSDIARNPNSAKLNFFYGLELEKNVATAEKDPARQLEIRKEGLKYLKRTIELVPDFAEGMSNVGNAYAYLGQGDSAEHYEEMALKLFPSHVMTINNLADLYYSRKKYRQSIDLSLRSISLFPGNISPYTNLGRSYLAIGRVDSTILYTKKAIALNPDNGFSYIIMAYAYKASGLADSTRKYEALAKKYKPDFQLN